MWLSNSVFLSWEPEMTGSTSKGHQSYIQLRLMLTIWREDYQSFRRKTYDEDIIKRSGELCDSRQIFCDLSVGNLTNSRNCRKLLLEYSETLQQQETKETLTCGKLWRRRPESEPNLRSPSERFQFTQCFQQKVQVEKWQDTFAVRIDKKVRTTNKKRQQDSCVWKDDEESATVDTVKPYQNCAKLKVSLRNSWTFVVSCFRQLCSFSQFISEIWECSRSWI